MIAARITSYSVLALVCSMALPGAAAAAPAPACAAPSPANGTYHELRVPGGKEMDALAINAWGEIVGSYRDAQDRVHGFVYRHGTFRTIDVPNAMTTAAVDINDLGTIAGNFDGHGFVLRRGTFTAIDAPGAFETEVTAINNFGVIGGLGLEPDGFDGTQVGFVRHRDGSFERIAFENVASALVKDINDRGDLLVNTDQSQLLRIRGRYHTIQPCRPNDVVFRITRLRHFVGTTEDTSLGMFVGLVQTPRQYVTYRYPNSTQTIVRDVNAFGVAVGQATDPVLGTIAFVFVPKRLQLRFD